MEGQATYPAANLGYAGQARTISPSVKAERPATEMEALTGNLADTARRLNMMADRLERRIANFLQAPTSPPGENPAATPEPQPGTIGALKFWHGRVNEETKRIDQALETLAGIL